MCLLMVGQKAKPEERLILLAEEQNPDGGGIAWRDHKAKKVRYEKGIDSAEILQILKRVEPPVVVHFRIASAGPKTKQLCHPFPVDAKASLNLSGTTDAIIAHNGTLNSWKFFLMNNLSPTNRLPAGDWSDTRAMAWLAYLHGPEIFQLLDEKVIYMSMNRVKGYALKDWSLHKQDNGGEIWVSYDPFEAARRWAESRNMFLQQHSEEGGTTFRSANGITYRRNFKSQDSEELQRQIKEKLASGELSEEELANYQAAYDPLIFEKKHEQDESDLPEEEFIDLPTEDAATENKVFEATIDLG